MSIVLDGTTGITTPALASTTLTSPVIAGTPTGVGVLTSGTAVASTSGTSIDFTGIPSWVKRVTVMFSGVSTNGTSNLQIQIGSGSVETTGYNSGAFDNDVGAHSLAGFIVSSQNAAGAAFGGVIGVYNVSGNIWASSGAIAWGQAGYFAASGGYKTTASTLDRVRITTVNGTDTFDAGSINIMYE